MDAIICGTCREELTQAETGSWIDESGKVWCAIDEPVIIPPQTLHTPLLTPEWREQIKRLFGSSPKFWTPRELGRLMALSEAQIKEVLDTK